MFYHIHKLNLLLLLYMHMVYIFLYDNNFHMCVYYMIIVYYIF